MQTTMLALTERMQRLEQQPCSRCRDAEANAAEFLSHLSSGLVTDLLMCPQPCFVNFQPCFLDRQPTLCTVAIRVLLRVILCHFLGLKT